ncbi:MAG: methyltransferase domain-containing protein [Flavobacteriales bacterium]|nr:methyltransferase domain-containing protein [Flavobacteriales bacterium]
MGVRMERRKKRVFLLSLLYRIDRALPFSKERKLRWYLDLEWIFDRLAMETSFKYYAAAEHPHRRYATMFLERHLNAGHAVLDLGCSTGDVSAVLAELAGNVVGVDHDEASIARARQKHQAANLTFLHMDALEFLRNSEKRFDVLVLSHILEHLDEPEAFLERFKSYFKWIYIELPDFDKTFLNHYRQHLKADLIHTDDDHVSEFDRDELRGMLDRCGIQVLESEYRFGIQRLWCRVGT